jgi:hypothetical protein
MISSQIKGDGFQIMAPVAVSGGVVGPQELWMLVTQGDGDSPVLGPFKDLSYALARAGLLADGSDSSCYKVVRYLRDDSDVPCQEMAKNWQPRPFIAVRRAGDQGDGEVGLLLTDGLRWLVSWPSKAEPEGPFGTPEIYRRFRPAALIQGGADGAEQCTEATAKKGQKREKESS